ncbi:transposase [Bacillus sp. FJAT-26390]|uniref:transposase n=1 Tax=Bacillus sp. FJAT-26390 TaxID=1743142 RepID=UPI000807D054|nr:transposase [Bacillus sp. FJAT-26390]OBZ13791.1 hypothetical protein A7975_13385 [Bacillus sp. FJAT-26390]
MRRKRQSEAYKMKVVEEALQGGNFSHTARKHDLNPESVRVWVREYRDSLAVEKKEVAEGPIPEEDYELKYNRAMKILGEKEVELEILRELLKMPNPAYPKR